MSREAIYQALFERIKDLPGLVTASRRVRHWSKVPVVEQPALFLEQTGERMQYSGNLPKKLLVVDLAIYVNTADDPETPATSRLNPLVDAVEAALEPGDGAEEQTLGGLVEYCRIAGEIDYLEPPDITGQAVAIIPVDILAT